MKRIGHVDGMKLYDAICSDTNILQALGLACKDHAKDKAVQRIKENKERYAIALKEILVNESFHYGRFKRKIINERGKVRELCFTRTFPDRAIQHCVFNVIAPILHSTIPSCSYAAIKGRGTHACSMRLRNDLKDDWSGTRYCLKGDIRHFFDSIDRKRLFDMIRRKIKCRRTLNILHTIIFDVPGDRGLPIGLFSSQILSVFFLSKFIHYIKERLYVRYLYVYMDDMVVLHCSKIVLRSVMHHIIRYLDGIGLSLKDNHSISPVEKRRVDVVGFVHNHDTVMVRKRTKMAYRRRVFIAIRHIAGHIPLTRHDMDSITCYEGIFSWSTDDAFVRRQRGSLEYALSHRLNISNISVISCSSDMTFTVRGRPRRSSITARYTLGPM